MGPGVVDDARLVDAWAAAGPQPAWRRVPALLAALDGLPAGEAAQLSIGAVAAAVLRLVRPWSPGGLEATVACRACGEQLAVTVPLDDLLSVASDPAAGEATADLEVAGRRLTVRAPRPDDVAAAATAPDAEAARRVLLSRCVTPVDPADDRPIDDETVAPAVAEAWEALDPLAVVSFAVTCPACGLDDAPLADLVGWGWSLVDARVQLLLADVHRLASAYGWSEADVLALGPWRRRIYLELVP
jgi:hypothetical protein